MGSGTAGGFGCTRGGILDSLSDLLTLGSLIPGIDTLFDLAAIPVDLARGDFLSAGLDALGVIPLLGEAADAAKLAKMADNVIDATKAADKLNDAGKAADKIFDLPKSPLQLKIQGWTETTSQAMKKNTSSRTYTKNGLNIRFDKGKKGAPGYGGKDHYHIMNPNSKGKHDYYLDKNGNPVPKNSKASHILP